MSSLGFKGYAHGAIKTRNELLDLIIEARKEKKAIRLNALGVNRNALGVN